MKTPILKDCYLFIALIVGNFCLAQTVSINLQHYDVADDDLQLLLEQFVSVNRDTLSFIQAADSFMISLETNIGYNESRFDTTLTIELVPLVHFPDVSCPYGGYTVVDGVVFLLKRWRTPWFEVNQDGCSEFEFWIRQSYQRTEQMNFEKGIFILGNHPPFIRILYENGEIINDHTRDELIEADLRIKNFLK